jgi:hypothetical protein
LIRGRKLDGDDDVGGGECSRVMVLRLRGGTCVVRKEGRKEGRKEWRVLKRRGGNRAK